MAVRQVRHLLAGIAHKARNRLRRTLGPELRFAKRNPSAFENHFRAAAERASGAVTVASYPSYLCLDPSSVCNLRCPSCPTGIENAFRGTDSPVSYRRRAMLSVDLFDSLLGEMGEYLFLIQFYNWGEPLLNRDLPYFLRRAREYDICTEIHSNLSMRISDDFVEDLLRSGVDSLCASIDGFSQESYGTYRVGGDLELAKENLLRFVAARDRLGVSAGICWNYLVFSFNEHEVDLARRFCEGHGILFRRKDAFIDAERHPDWVPGYQKVVAALKPARPAPPPGEAPAASPPGSCGWHYGYSVVNPDGSVSPCCAPWDQSYDFGTVLPGSRRFADVWNNDSFRRARAALGGRREGTGLPGTETLCEKCPFGPVKDHLAEYDRAVEARCAELFGKAGLARMKGAG